MCYDNVQNAEDSEQYNIEALYETVKEFPEQSFIPFMWVGKIKKKKWKKQIDKPSTVISNRGQWKPGSTITNLILRIFLLIVQHLTQENVNDTHYFGHDKPTLAFTR